MFNALIEEKDVDSSFDIWKADADASVDALYDVYANFSDAKRYVLSQIDAEIKHLKARRKYISTMKKRDVWSPSNS